MGVDYLEFMAKITIFASIFTVIYLCSYLVWRISRLPNPVQYAPSEIVRKPVGLPFKVKLLDESKQTENIVTVQLTCYQHSIIKLLWGIEVNYLAKLMNSPWRSLHGILNELEAGSSNEDKNQYLAATQLDINMKSKNPESEDDQNNDNTLFDDIVTIKPPESLKWEDLVNKYLYPLVMVIMPETYDTEEISGESIGDKINGLFVILHIKNVTANVPTTVLAEYVKMDSGHIFMLKPLYVVEDGLPNDEDDPAAPDEVEEAFSGVSCSVCQSLPVSRAILPCRHVCLCAFCFDKVERCPICRGQLLHYFRTRSENYMSDAPNAVPLTRPLTCRQRFDLLSERLNQFLGFT